MSRYGYDSDHRQGELDFERNGRYGYDDRYYRAGYDEARRYNERRHLGNEQYDRDYRVWFDEARRYNERKSRSGRV